VAPEERSITVFAKGIPQGLITSIPSGGYC